MYFKKEKAPRDYCELLVRAVGRISHIEQNNGCQTCHMTVLSDGQMGYKISFELHDDFEIYPQTLIGSTALICGKCLIEAKEDESRWGFGIVNLHHMSLHIYDIEDFELYEPF